MDEPTAVDRTRTGIYALLSFVISIGFGVGLPYLLSLEIADYRSTLDLLPSIFRRHTAITAMYAAPLAAFVFLIFAYFSARYCVIGKPVSRRAGEIIMKAVVGLSILTLLAFVIIRFAANAYWENAFREVGYQRCPNSFSLTSRWLVDVWVQDPAYCRDPEVRAMMASPRHGIDDINEYLRAQER